MEQMHPLDMAGVRPKIIDALGVSQQAISNWKAREVPIEHCASIEKATDGAVTRKDLRPNDWHLIWPELVKSRKQPAKAA